METNFERDKIIFRSKRRKAEFIPKGIDLVIVRTSPRELMRFIKYFSLDFHTEYEP